MEATASCSIADAGFSQRYLALFGLLDGLRPVDSHLDILLLPD